MSNHKNRLERLSRAKSKSSIPDGAFGRLRRELDVLRVAGKPLSLAIAERVAILQRYANHQELPADTRAAIRSQIADLEHRRQEVLADERRVAERRAAAGSAEPVS